MAPETAAALLLIWALPLAYPAWLVASGLRWRARGARAARATHGEAFVRGVVEADAAPVANETDQRRAKNFQSGGGTRWEEIAFRPHARPFVLRRASGERVTVEPEEPVALLWSPSETRADPATPQRRTRIARLDPGAEVDVLGWLAVGARAASAPYRDGPVATLTPPRRGPMLVSKVPLRTQYARMARYRAYRAGLVAGVVVLVHVMFGGLWAYDRALLGTTDELTWLRFAVGVAAGALVFVVWHHERPWSIGPLEELDDRPAPRSGKK